MDCCKSLTSKVITKANQNKVSEEFLGGIICFSGGTKVGSVTTVNQQNKGHTTQRVNRTLNEQ